MNQRTLFTDALFIVGLTITLVLFQKFKVLEDYLKFVFVGVIGAYYLAKLISWKLSNHQTS